MNGSSMWFRAKDLFEPCLFRRDTTTVLSDLIRIADPGGGEKDLMQRRTAFVSSRLMCRFCSVGDQVPQAEFPWEQAPPHPDWDASVQMVVVGGGFAIGIGLLMFCGWDHH